MFDCHIFYMRLSIKLEGAALPTHLVCGSRPPHWRLGDPIHQYSGRNAVSRKWERIKPFKNTLKRVELVHNNSKIPIIATGGIMDYSQVKVVQDKGAGLVGMATQLVTDPFKVPQINIKLSNAL